MIAILQHVNSIRSTLAIEIAVVMSCGLLSVLAYYTAPRTIAFVITLALVSFLPLTLGVLAVSGTANLDTPEIVAASVMGLKGELIKRFIVLLANSIVFVVVLYFSLSLSSGWPRDRGIDTLIQFSSGVVIVALSGMFTMLLGSTPKVAILTVVIVWIGLTFLIDPYFQSFLIARLIPLSILLCLSIAAFRRVEDGKILMAMEGQA